MNLVIRCFYSEYITAQVHVAPHALIVDIE